LKGYKKESYREKKMARKSVVAIECGRCNRTEYVEEAPESDYPALTITVRGHSVASYDDLCANCEEIVTTAVTNLTKPMEKRSPIRKKKEAASAPAQETPNGVQHMRVPRG